MKTKFFTLALTCLSTGAATLALVGEADGAGKKKDKESGEILFDFTDENPGDKWITVNDNVMGGRSKGGFSFKKTKLVFSGSTNTNGGGFPPSEARPWISALKARTA